MESLGSILRPILEAHAIAQGWLPAELPPELQGQGFIGYRELDDIDPGKILAVLPLTFGRARLTYGNGPKATLQYDWDPEGLYIADLGYDGGCDEVWDFDTPESAIDAMSRFPESVRT